jgi:hypothetical protein
VLQFFKKTDFAEKKAEKKIFSVEKEFQSTNVDG